jgi:hypothetical protein
MIQQLRIKMTIYHSGEEEIEERYIYNNNQILEVKVS